MIEIGEGVVSGGVPTQEIQLFFLPSSKLEKKKQIKELIEAYRTISNNYPQIISWYAELE